MNKKILIFLEIAKELNHYGIFPILYGSLGVSRLIEIKDIDDIDIVIPDVWLTNKFVKFKKIMEDIGFKQDLYYSHEFNRIKSGERISFEPKSKLKKDMGVLFKNMRITKFNKIKFGELSINDWIRIYSKTVKLWEKRMTKMQYKIKKLNLMKLKNKNFWNTRKK